MAEITQTYYLTGLGGQKSKVSPSGLKSRCWQGLFLLGKNVFPCLSAGSGGILGSWPHIVPVSVSIFTPGL